MSQQKEQNAKLNFLKGCACIGVVFIHISFPGLFGEIINYASTFAVPTFYMVAGYYAYGKDTATIKRRLSKIGKILLWGYLLFFAYCSLAQIMNHTFLIWLSKNFNWFTPLKYTIFCTIDFAVPLWYLIAMLELYIFWYFIVKRQKEPLVLKFTPWLFALLFLSVFYCEEKHLAWFWKMNFLTQALPWFLLGYFLHTDRAGNFRSITGWQAGVCAVAGCVITVLPTMSRLPYSMAIIGQILYAFGLFILALKNPADGICGGLEYIGRNLSLLIYLLHTPVAGVLGFVCRRILGTDTDAAVWLWFQPLLAQLCTVLASWFLFLVSRRIRARKSADTVL